MLLKFLGLVVALAVVAMSLDATIKRIRQGPSQKPILYLLAFLLTVFLLFIIYSIGSEWVEYKQQKWNHLK